MEQNKNYVHKTCSMDKRLEIMYDEFTNQIMFSRCCYLYPFASISIKDFLKMDDIFEFATREWDHKLKAKEWCGASCDLKPEIKVVTVGLSRACNLHCYHCFFSEHKDTKDMKDLYFATLERMKGHNLDIIHMQSSGEVFFYYYKIVNFLRGLTPSDTKEVNFQTNGNLLTEERIKELKEISEKTGVKFTFSYSIDAVTEETYKKVRIGGDFKKVIAAFENSIKYFSKNNVEASFTIKEYNKHEAKEFRRYFKSKYGCTRTYITYDLFDNRCLDFFQNELKQEEICG